MAENEPLDVDPRPLYLQVKDALLKRLATDYWRPGELLPSEPKLADEFNVSQGTVRRALEELAGQNLILREQGRGTRVAMHTPDRALFGFFHLVARDDTRELPESHTVRVSRAKAVRAERDRLDLAQGDFVVRIVRLRFLGSRPKILETIRVSHAMFPGLEKTPAASLPNTIYEHYESQFGVTIVRAEERLRAVPASRAEARLLEIPEGTPLLEIDRVARGHMNQPIEWRSSRCLTDNHHYVNVLE